MANAAAGKAAMAGRLGDLATFTRIVVRNIDHFHGVRARDGYGAGSRLLMTPCEETLPLS